MEILRPNNFTKGEQDTDVVITTTELIRMIRNSGIEFSTLVTEACDMPFGFGSGAGVIFGVTGGVTEAMLRRFADRHDKATMDSVAEAGARGEDGIKEFTVTYKGTPLHVCVVSGLANAHTVMENIRSGRKQYHIVEVMACRRGCIMGGGQPPRAGSRTKTARMEGLYQADNVTSIRKADENPLIVSLYDGLLKGKVHELLHVDEY